MNETFSLLSISKSTLPFISLPPFLLPSRLSFRSVQATRSLSPFITQSNPYFAKITGSITNSQFSHYLSQILHLSQIPSHVINTRQSKTDGSEWTISSTVFRDSGSNLPGGILYAAFAGFLAILDSQFINNYAKEKGGSLFASVAEAFLRCLLFDLSRTETDEEAIGGNAFWIEDTSTEMEDITLYRSWITTNTGDGVYFFYRGFSKATRVNSTSSFSNLFGEVAGTHYECERGTTYSFINAVNGAGHNFIHLRNIGNASLEFYVDYFNVINCSFVMVIFHSQVSKIYFKHGCIFGNDNTKISPLVFLVDCIGDFVYTGLAKVQSIQTVDINLSLCKYPVITNTFTPKVLANRAQFLPRLIYAR